MKNEYTIVAELVRNEKRAITLDRDISEEDMWTSFAVIENKKYSLEHTHAENIVIVSSNVSLINNKIYFC